jgi:hypothetical protein
MDTELIVQTTRDALELGASVSTFAGLTRARLAGRRCFRDDVVPLVCKAAWAQLDGLVELWRLVDAMPHLMHFVPRVDPMWEFRLPANAKLHLVFDWVAVSDAERADAMHVVELAKASGLPAKLTLRTVTGLVAPAHFGAYYDMVDAIAPIVTQLVLGWAPVEGVDNTRRLPVFPQLRELNIGSRPAWPVTVDDARFGTARKLVAADCMFAVQRQALSHLRLASFSASCEDAPAALDPIDATIHEFDVVIRAGNTRSARLDGGATVFTAGDGTGTVIDAAGRVTSLVDVPHVVDVPRALLFNLGARLVHLEVQNEAQTCNTGVVLAWSSLDVIGALPSLRHLRIPNIVGYRRVRGIPLNLAFLRNLPRLKVLDVSGNKLVGASAADALWQHLADACKTTTLKQLVCYRCSPPIRRRALVTLGIRAEVDVVDVVLAGG